MASLALVLCVSGTGCSRGCKGDHPYVPYSVGTGLAEGGAVGDDVDGAAVVDGGESFPSLDGVAAPLGASSLTLEGATLVAPAGRLLVMGLLADLDGDGARDGLAIVRGPSDAGEVVFFKGQGTGVLAPLTVATPPTAASPVTPDGGGCLGPVRLGRVGPRTIFAELSLACGAEGKPEGGSLRWFTVLTFRSAPRALLSATLADAPGAPPLTVDADGADVDHDGLDDVTLRVRASGGAPPFEPGPAVGALLRWFDRPAGMSRDPDEPDASLRGEAAAALVRAAKVKEAPSVPLAAQQMRFLYGAVCAEGGAPRLGGLPGGSLNCGPSRALEEVGLAEVRAFTTLGDPLRAAAALERAQRAPATKTSGRAETAAVWIAQAAPPLNATTVRVVSAVPNIDRGRGPAWGALAFDGGGKLLVRTAAGVVRVDPDQGDEAQADDVAPWKSSVLSPDGKLRWIEAYASCTGPALRATAAPTDDGEAKDLPLPIPAPLGLRCASAKGEPVTASPVAWGPGGLEALVLGEPLLFAPGFARATLLASPLEGPWTPGAPRSPNGKWRVTPTTHGLLVRGAKARLYRAKELAGGYTDLRDCAISDDGIHVACVRSGRAVVGRWEVAP